MKGDDDEVTKLMKVWFTVIASLTFCYLILTKIPKGIPRLILLLPVISVFIYLPLTISSPHAVAVTFFFITWLGNFKLLLLAFNQGPLSSHTLSLPHFIFLASVPIQFKPSNAKEITQRGLKSPFNYAVKFLVAVLMLKAYEYRSVLHPYVIKFLYCCHAYLTLEIILVTAAIPARAVLGIEIEPQFDDPYLATSLQDFWGRRWNLMVTTILRPTIYLPVRNLVTRGLGKKAGLVAGLMSTFLVSGLMHEWGFYLLSHVPPTWEVTCFFVIQGVCIVVEIEVRKVMVDKWRWWLHPLISRALTLTFAMVTAIWLFFSPVVRYEVDLKAIRESSVLLEFFKTAHVLPLLH